MTEQDATEPDGGSEAQTDAPDDGDDLEDIAEEPAGDPDEALDDIAEEPAEPAEGTADGTDADGAEVSEADESDDATVDEELVERVAESDAEEIAAEIAGLRQQVADLQDALADREDEIEDLESRLKRKQADFQNYKKRQKKRLEEEKERATEDFVERLLDVRDNLKRALDQDDDTDIRGGVESTLRQFDEQLERENVTAIEPDPGDEVDPQRHEALATIASDQPEDTVAEVHRPGYEMAGKVLRPAQVAVSDGSGHDG